MYQNCFGTPTAVGNFNPSAYPTAVPMPQNQSPVNFRFIDKPEDILPSNIPMNGDLGIFPLRDQSAIITKQWKSDGSIQTKRFVPEAIDEVTPSNPILERLDQLIELMTPKPVTKATKAKEAVG